ncbi:MAG TPA: diacylglycerol kinase family protein [Patescibacteria group bacterium]|nr:diacylglycerol kinase family protein [Patescibacteria group bacterium]
MKSHSLLQSFQFAWQGIRYALKHDKNFTIHLAATVLVIGLTIYFDVSPFEIGLLGVMILLVIIAEMLNTAIEKMVDLITKEYREEAKIAKDVSAGMVLMASLGALVVGVIIFTPYLLNALGIVH